MIKAIVTTLAYVSIACGAYAVGKSGQAPAGHKDGKTYVDTDKFPTAMICLDDSDKHCAPISVFYDGHDAAFAEQTKLESWTGILSDVPTFGDARDAEAWGNRYSEITKRQNHLTLPIQWVDYKDSVICVRGMETLIPCFSLYDITER